MYLVGPTWGVGRDIIIKKEAATLLCGIKRWDLMASAMSTLIFSLVCPFAFMTSEKRQGVRAVALTRARPSLLAFSSASFSWYIRVLFFLPWCFPDTLRPNIYCSLLCFSSNLCTVDQPRANAAAVSPVGLITVGSRSNALTRFDWKNFTCPISKYQRQPSHRQAPPTISQFEAATYHRPRSMNDFFSPFEEIKAKKKSPWCV